jgi:hypothetical protein
MKPYNPKRDYCGPEGLHISKLIPRKIGGVDINFACYMHDTGWAAGEGHKKADIQFRHDIQAQFYVARKPLLGLVVSWVYYASVRLGRTVLWLRGVK